MSAPSSTAKRSAPGRRRGPEPQAVVARDRSAPPRRAAPRTARSGPAGGRSGRLCAARAVEGGVAGHEEISGEVADGVAHVRNDVCGAREIPATRLGLATYAQLPLDAPRRPRDHATSMNAKRRDHPTRSRAGPASRPARAAAASSASASDAARSATCTATTPPTSCCPRPLWAELFGGRPTSVHHPVFPDKHGSRRAPDRRAPRTCAEVIAVLRLNYERVMAR